MVGRLETRNYPEENQLVRKTQGVLETGIKAVYSLQPQDDMYFQMPTITAELMKSRFGDRAVAWTTTAMHFL